MKVAVVLKANNNQEGKVSTEIQTELHGTEFPSHEVCKIYFWGGSNFLKLEMIR